mmetsp:Transcript_71215/g.201797  ORF Transcript_71215/g.201797 Transcript_71215/m.201797 type:complete len:197 (+) Transcript_71215:50-640(+)
MKPLVVCPKEGKSFEELVAVLQQCHAERLDDGSYRPFFPEFPRRKNEIKLVTTGLIYTDVATGNMGLIGTGNYELSAAAGARCSEQNALAVLIHYGVAPAQIRYLANVSHSIPAAGNPVPLALGPCPICQDHLRGLLKGTPEVAGVRVYAATPGREAWLPSLGELIGGAHRGVAKDVGGGQGGSKRPRDEAEVADA